MPRKELFLVDQSETDCSAKACLKASPIFPFGADFLRVGAVGENLLGIINIDTLNRETVNRVAYHSIQPFILAFAAQSDFALGIRVGSVNWKNTW